MITWKSWHDSPDQGYWDQTMLADLLALIHPDINILVTPGHWRDATPVNEWLDENGPALVFITSDEEGQCPFWDVNAPVWKMTPNPGLAYQPDRAIPLGYTPHTRPNLAEYGLPLQKAGWFFSGQNTNARRQSAFDGLVPHLMPEGTLIGTDAFGDGLTHDKYIHSLWLTAWVPSPAGNVRPECFRMWEALEAGAVPILDATSPHGDQNYWPKVLGDHPLPVLADWSQVGSLLEQPAPLTEVAVWYSGFKARFKRDIWDAWAHLTGAEPWVAPVDRITTIITASLIPEHPGFATLAQTVESVRERLPGNRIIIAFDGPSPQRPGVAETNYEEHIRRVCYHANLNWPEVQVHYSGEWKHQAGTIRDVLPLVYPDYATLLMLEHDTPLVGEIPFHRLTELLYQGDFDSVRFHHETAIPPEHDYLMDGLWDDPVGGIVQIRATRQYSQRPHLALASTYRAMLERLPVTARTFIEDWAYGYVAAGDWPYKFGIYTPKGNIKRSTHLDGRGDWEKEPVTFE